MQRIKPTRSELLRTRKRIKLAKKGHELLKKKQDSLVMEFFKLLKGMKNDREELQRRFDAAQRALNEARALESDLRIGAAALAVQEQTPAVLEVKNIAGVRIPVLAEKGERKYPVHDSIMMQDLSAHYQKVLESILQLAAKQTAMRKMLIEIKRTKRRAHALEHILLPKLEHGLRQITFDLGEREREEFNRLKRRK